MNTITRYIQDLSMHGGPPLSVQHHIITEEYGHGICTAKMKLRIRHRIRRNRYNTITIFHILGAVKYQMVRFERQADLKNHLSLLIIRCLFPRCDGEHVVGRNLNIWNDAFKYRHTWHSCTHGSFGAVYRIGHSDIVCVHISFVRITHNVFENRA